LRTRVILLVVVSMCGGSTSARAELDAGDYAVGATTTSEERARLLEAIAAEREAEAAREEALQAAEAEARQRAAEAEARRPPEERLLEARCTKCHTLEQVSAARHTPIGWWFTVARMRWWNGAAMTGDEAAVLTAHLAQSQPARGGARLAEYGVAVLAVTVVPGAVLLHRLRLRRRRQRGHCRAGGPVGLMAGCVLAATLLLSPPRAAIAETAVNGQAVEPPSGESVPSPQEAPTKNTALDAAKADAPTEHRSPPTDEKPSEPPSMGLCSGQ
jgi:hypothetical protein